MFSSFSSFLPSALQPGQEQRSHQSLSTPNNDTPEPDANSQPLDDITSDSKSKKKDKREKLVNETFIVVRPPPSKSNHPLNLQVQLVPPQSRHDRPHATVQALDQSAKIQLIPLPIPLIFKERLLAGQSRLRFQLTPLQALYRHLLRRQLRARDVA
jgi:hypothetical protein